MCNGYLSVKSSLPVIWASRRENSSSGFFDQGPVVHSIFSRQFVKVPTTLSNPLLFLLKICENLLQCKRFSHFSNKK